MSKHSILIDFNGEEWDVKFTYSPGTNYPIHSASLEPNDPEEMEIEKFTHHTLPMSEEFLEQFLDDNREAIEQLVFENINDCW